MKNSIIFSLVLCALPGLTSPMELSPTSDTTASQVAQAIPSSPRTLSQADNLNSTSQNELEEEAKKLIYAYERRDDHLRCYFPALFSKKYEEDYPPGISSTDALQIAIVFNNLSRVKNYLFYCEMAQKSAFTPQSTQLMTEQIEKIEAVIHDSKSEETLTIDQNIEKLREIETLINTNHQIADLVQPEVDLIIGPSAKRRPLAEICGSPDKVEELNFVTRCFKNKLVVGLCAILVKAHVLKAQSLQPESQQKYLSDMAEINRLVWESYEKNPHLFDRLVHLNDSLLILQEKYNEVVKYQIKKNKLKKIVVK